jgi:hypothetical protein
LLLLLPPLSSLVSLLFFSFLLRSVIDSEPLALFCFVEVARAQNLITPSSTSFLTTNL